MSRKRYDRDEALDAAMHVFWSRGYRGSSLRELCEATRLNRKSLYAEFGDKASLFREALTRYTAGGVARSRAALEVEPLGTDNIRRYFSAMRYGLECRGCLMTMTINERALVPEACVDEVTAGLGEIEALLRMNLVADGRDPTEVDRLATFLVFSLQGITTMGKLEGDEARLALSVRTVLSALD